ERRRRGRGQSRQRRVARPPSTISSAAMTKFVLPILILAALVAVLVAGLNRDPSYVPSPLIGKPAPDYTLPRLDDASQMIARKDLLGDVSVVNVWATWCAGCRQEHPFLVELARTGAVRIFGLNW